MRNRRPRGGEELSIQSASLSKTTLNSSDAHPKQRRQLRSSIDSAPSTPAALKSFDVNHVTSSSVKLKGTVYGTSSYSLKAVHVGFSTGGACMSGCFSQRTFATGRPVLVHWSSGRRPPPVGFPADGLPELTRQHCVMIAPGLFLLLLLSA